METPTRLHIVRPFNAIGSLKPAPLATCLHVQEKEEVVETPTMLHIMGQNNLLQRTGFKQGDVELED